MSSFLTPQFLTLYRALPERIRQQARQAYALFEQDPSHPSLHFRKVHSVRPICSARVSIDAVGIREGDSIFWFWIGPHAEYDRLLKQI